MKKRDLLVHRVKTLPWSVIVLAVVVVAVGLSLADGEPAPDETKASRDIPAFTVLSAEDTSDSSVHGRVTTGFVSEKETLDESSLVGVPDGLDLGLPAALTLEVEPAEALGGMLRAGDVIVVELIPSGDLVHGLVVHVAKTPIAVASETARSNYLVTLLVDDRERSSIAQHVGQGGDVSLLRIPGDL